MPDFVSTVTRVEALLRKIFPATELQYSEYLSQKYEAEVYLKREDQTPVRSYKIRGAFNFIHQMDQVERSRGVVCASAGNHAQGFAFACSYFGIKGTVFMPATTPKQKIDKTRSFGGDLVDIVLEGDTFDQANIAAIAFCKGEKASFVPPFDHPRIMEGQASVGAEVLSVIKPEVMVMPVGGGGLSAGVCRYFESESPDTDIYLTEPLGAPSLSKSLEAGERVTLEGLDTFVDGAAVGMMGDHTFKVLQKRVKNPVVLCPENRICRTMVNFLNHEGIVLEPAGALAIDALEDIKLSIKGKKVVCVASGGNFDFERLPEVKERAMRFEGTKKYFILRLPQRPGALKEFLNLLGPEDDIARFEYLKKSAQSFGSILVGVETKSSDNFHSFSERMKIAGFTYQDVTDDPVIADLVI